MSSVKVLLPLVGASKGWKGDSFQGRENLQIAWVSHSWPTVPWEEPKAVGSSSQRPEVIRRVKQRRGWHGRMVLCVWEDLASTKGAMPVLVPPLPTMQPHSDSPASLSPFLSEGTWTPASQLVEAEQSKQLSLPWKTQGPTNSITPDGLSFSNALA